MRFCRSKPPAPQCPHGPRCAHCNPRMAYYHISPAHTMHQVSNPLPYMSPAPPSPLSAAGAPVAAWTSPRTTVWQYSNGRVQFDENGSEWTPRPSSLPHYSPYQAPNYWPGVYHGWGGYYT
ncbi:unnamed protein product [Mycena citricolor]|uniref:Uncharacterized protein n=1 Tax=Mycena citricolor TaxID=2018698 RepID=A0AAD2K4D4_9AGAR|nr:unnamed protein product [Mycena citricolor]